MALLNGCIGLLALLHLSGCIGCVRPASFDSVDLISPPEALAPLQRGDLAEARRILESRHAARPSDAELSYTLGCVCLLQSDTAADRGSRRHLQSRGWQLVEAAAAGQCLSAEALLAHASLLGRWGKGRSAARHAEHVRRVIAVSQALQVQPDMDALRRQTWARLTDEQILYNQDGRLFRQVKRPGVP